MLKKWWLWTKNILPWFGRKQPLGQRGERAAARYLRRKGYRILCRNWRTSIGEIDLVVEPRDRHCVVIVEVKSGSSDSPAPELHCDWHKQRQLNRLARQLVARHGLQGRLIRFDVIGVVWPKGMRQPSRIRHHERAFEATS